jgi:hypothetical protein
MFSVGLRYRWAPSSKWCGWRRRLEALVGLAVQPSVGEAVAVRLAEMLLDMAATLVRALTTTDSSQ